MIDQSQFYIAKRQFLSLATSRESGQFQKFQSIIIARVPLLCDNFGGKVLDRFKFISVESIVRHCGSTVYYLLSMHNKQQWFVIYA